MDRYSRTQGGQYNLVGEERQAFRDKPHTGHAGWIKIKIYYKSLGMKLQLLNNDLYRENQYHFQTIVKYSHELLTFKTEPIRNFV